jgi:hypothetical protein
METISRDRKKHAEFGIKLDLGALQFLLETTNDLTDKNDSENISDWPAAEKIKLEAIRNLFHAKSVKLYDETELSRDVLDPNIFPILNPFRAGWSEEAWRFWGKTKSNLKKRLKVDFQHIIDLKERMGDEEPNDKSKKMWREVMEEKLQ